MFPRLRTASQQGPALRDKTMRLYRHAQRSARGIATDQLNVMGIGQLEKALHVRLHPVSVVLRQRQCKRGPGGFRPHGGQVAQIDRQRLVADGGSRRIDGKMPSGHQGVGANHQLMAGRDLQQGGIITDAGEDIVTRRTGTHEVTADDVELVDGHGSARLSAGLVIFRTAQSAGRPVKHTVDKGMPLLGTEFLRQLHRLVDHHAIGDIDTLL